MAKVEEPQCPCERLGVFSQKLGDERRCLACPKREEAMPKRKSIIERAIDQVLDKGLKESTWAQQFPDAYADLAKHNRPDIVKQIEGFINRTLPTAIRAFELYSETLDFSLRRGIVEVAFKAGWSACKEELLGRES